MPDAPLPPVDPASPPWTERFVRLRGMQLALCEWGPADGPTALLLHGWLDQAAAWHPVAARLAGTGWRVIALDHRGHGRSDHTPPGTTYHFPEYLADLDALVHQLGGTIDLLVGHSMGGTIASLFAGLRPQAARCVVLVEGLGPPIFDATTAADQMVGFLDHQRTSRTHKVLEDVDAAALRLRRMNPALPPGLATALALRATRAAPGGVVWRWDALHRTRSAVAYDVDRHMAILARITAPVTVVLGTRSWYPGLPDLGTRLAAIPTLVARHDVDAGHAVQLDQPALLARLLRAAAGSAGLAAYP